MKIGDKVKIRKDLKVEERYGNDIFASRMEKYKGKTATIINYNYNRATYLLDIDNGHWNWTSEMFEKNTKEKLEKELDKLKKELENFKEPILDDIEKEYLRAVIKPFKEEVKFIRKGEYSDYYKKENYEWIGIYNKDLESTMFPKFEKNKMYKGMEVNKNYTLEELDLQ